MRSFVLLLLLAMLSSALPAQETVPVAEPQLMFSLVPQYAFQSGFRLDVDLPLNKQHWIQLAPVFFAGNHVEMGITTADKLSGIALHAYHRFYPDPSPNRRQPYLAWGPVFQHYAIDYKIHNGNLKVDKHTNINRLGIDLTGGFVTQGSALFFDFYAGAGIRQAFLSGDKDSGEKFNDSFLDFGYSGVLLVAGVRVGAVIKKSEKK
ncbi:MAG TPA: hypothetical protein PKE03_02585 [Bacteroidales bacterium]|nr:hypothetical protein [Bacteroidales bacterium]